MLGPILQKEIPVRISLPPTRPVAPTSNRFVRALFTATVFAGLIAAPALAQDLGAAQAAQAAPARPADGYGTDVFADTLKNTTPHSMPRFTETPKSAQGEEEEAPHPEALGHPDRDTETCEHPVERSHRQQVADLGCHERSFVGRQSRRKRSRRETRGNGGRPKWPGRACRNAA